jgi:ectoine hydroxylase-related dioxygenase (phytanoyl-CoA dioxygenase family)
MGAADFTFMRGSTDPQALRGAFSTHGILVVKEVLDAAPVAALRDALGRLIRHRLQSLGHAAQPDLGLDEGLNRLLAVDQRHGMEIIRIAKDLPEFYSFLCNASILDVVGHCLGTTTFQAVHDIAQMRIDPPNHFERNFEWHQDYPYNVMSRDAVTLWAPLTPITFEMGPMEVIPGSHEQIQPVAFDPSNHEAGRGTGHTLYRMDQDVSGLGRSSLALTGIGPGDAVFFHALLVHRSGRNVSAASSRWVVNTRYGNAVDEAVVGRGWRAVRDRTQDVFRELHSGLLK